MKFIHCRGTPYEIGFTHGSQAKEEIPRSIEFYKRKFKKTSQLEWPEVLVLANQYVENIQKQWPAYLEEMKGIADGSGRSHAEIIALNVRTELAFGMFSDGCTALSWLTDDSSFLAQNWDWEIDQQENLIQLTIEQAPKPTIKMITEAGIIGKIGLNSAGVGVCLNAIRAKGVDPTRLPCHMGLRLALDSHSREGAISELSRRGVASSCHMLIADDSGAKGIEWSSLDRQVLSMNNEGRVLHTNHYLLDHPGVTDTFLVGGDTKRRLKRLAALLNSMPPNPELKDVQALFTDRENYPSSICRGPEDEHAATLFNIVMDLKAKRAEVIVGRPTEPEGRFSLRFD